MVKEIKRKTFQYIESEIYSYHDTLKQIRLLEYEIEHATSTFTDEPQAGRNSVRTITDTTATKATALLEHKQLKRMREKTNAIEKAYNRLPKEKQELISLYYWERPGELTWDGVAKKLHIGRRTALRWRETFVHSVAEELGER